MLTKAELRAIWDRAPEHERGKSFRKWAAALQAACKANPQGEALLRKTVRWENFLAQVSEGLANKDLLAAIYLVDKTSKEQFESIVRAGMDEGKTPEEVVDVIIEEYNQWFVKDWPVQ